MVKSAQAIVLLKAFVMGCNSRKNLVQQNLRKLTFVFVSCPGRLFFFLLFDHFFPYPKHNAGSLYGAN